MEGGGWLRFAVMATVSWQARVFFNPWMTQAPQNKMQSNWSNMVKIFEELLVRTNLSAFRFGVLHLHCFSLLSGCYTLCKTNIELC